VDRSEFCALCESIALRQNHLVDRGCAERIRFPWGKKGKKRRRRMGGEEMGEVHMGEQDVGVATSIKSVFKLPEKRGEKEGGGGRRKERLRKGISSY